MTLPPCNFATFRQPPRWQGEACFHYPLCPSSGLVLYYRLYVKKETLACH